jgi:hypothetical protein
MSRAYLAHEQAKNKKNVYFPAQDEHPNPHSTFSCERQKKKKNRHQAFMIRWMIDLAHMSKGASDFWNI